MSEWSVRRATTDDMEWMLKQCKDFMDYLRLPLKWDEDYIREVVRMYMQDHHVILVLKNTERAGVVAAMESPHPFDPSTKIMTEILWWVPEEWRKTRAGYILLGALEHIAETANALLVLSTEKHSPLNERTLNKRGYQLRELSYVKER